MVKKQTNKKSQTSPLFLTEKIIYIYLAELESGNENNRRLSLHVCISMTLKTIRLTLRDLN